VEGFGRDCFVEFLSSATQSSRNILSVLEQVFIPAVSHMKTANIHIGTKYQNTDFILAAVDVRSCRVISIKMLGNLLCNVHISLPFSYQFAILISVCNSYVLMYSSYIEICNFHMTLQFSYQFAILISVRNSHGTTQALT
jgi:hypothetical protein